MLGPRCDDVSPENPIPDEEESATYDAVVLSCSGHCDVLSEGYVQALKNLSRLR